MKIKQDNITQNVVDDNRNNIKVTNQWNILEPFFTEIAKAVKTL
ncbi:hypothetical protein [Lactobacillus sp. Sy-1]|nr:hypothetical protein [Lactobacillus sp. Sy-1]